MAHKISNTANVIRSFCEEARTHAKIVVTHYSFNWALVPKVMVLSPRARMHAKQLSPEVSVNSFYILTKTLSDDITVVEKSV